MGGVRSSTCALALAACAALLMAAADAAQFTPGELPEWVFMGKQRPLAQEDRDNALSDVAAMNEAGEPYDLIQYGDSLTADIRDSREQVWDEVFPPGEIRAQPLGMGGSTVQELADRIIRGGETPDLPPPRVVTLLVGYNNVRYRPDSDVADKIDWLLQWMAYNWPITRLAVSALIPNEFISLDKANAEIKAVAQKNGALFFDCGGDLDPLSDDYDDGTHLLPKGQRKYLECMRDAVAPLLAEGSAASPAPAPAP